jgi:hypothetical protein
MTGGVVSGVLVSRTEALQLMSDRLRDTNTDNATFVKLLDMYRDMTGIASKGEKKAEKETPKDDFDKVLALEARKKDGKEI